MLSLYSAVNLRRRGFAGTSGSAEFDISTTKESFTLSTSMTVLRPSEFGKNYRRGDCLSHVGREGSVNGYAKPTSPALEELAREGVNFTHAITVAPRTWQSFSSILTGVNPPRHGVRFLFDQPIIEGIPIMAPVMSEAGYRTAAFDGATFLEDMTGGTAFDHYFANSGNDETVLGKVQDWMSRNRKIPFLAFVKTKGGHWPYTVTRWLDPEDACAGHDHCFNLG